MVPDDLGESLHDSTAQPTITTEHFFDFGHTRGREEIEERERGAHADAPTAHSAMSMTWSQDSRDGRLTEAKIRLLGLTRTRLAHNAAMECLDRKGK